MRNNVKLAWIISGLVLGTGMLFACPVPVPKLSPLLVPVNSSSVAALDSYIPQTDDDTYDIVTGDPTITSITIYPANGGSWDGVATITWSKPGNYSVDVTISATWWDEEKEAFYDTSYTKTFQVTVVDVNRVEFQWGSQPWTDITAKPVNYVPVGSIINFRTFPDPADASWPDSKPVWGGSVSDSGVSTVSHSYTTPGTYNVSAECGNTVQGQICAVKVDVTIDFRDDEPDPDPRANAQDASGLDMSTFSVTINDNVIDASIMTITDITSGGLIVGKKLQLTVPSSILNYSGSNEVKANINDNAGNKMD